MINTRHYDNASAYNSLAVNGSAGAPLSLRALITALAVGTGVPPTKIIIGFEITPAAAVNATFSPGVGAEPPHTPLAVPAAVAGGGNCPIPITGKYFDMVDPLDKVLLLAQAAGATTVDVVFYHGAN